jgi:hypothetical protein
MEKGCREQGAGGKEGLRNEDSGFRTQDSGLRIEEKTITNPGRLTTDHG